MSAETITQQALDLPLRERARMAQALWASIDDQLEDTAAGQAVLVARERDADFDAGAVAGETHEEVMRKGRQQLR